MLARRDVEVGKYYVNDYRRKAREVVMVDRQKVVFNIYDLKTGKLCGTPQRQCSKEEIIHWADREATGGEVDTLQREEMEALFQVKDTGPVDTAPHREASQASLHEEARRAQFLR